MRFIILIIIIAAIILLQIYLSKRENKWLGLILPIMSFLFALLVVPLNMMVHATGIDANYISTLIVAFLLYNIPTIVFMIIYVVCRKQRIKQVLR